MKLKKYFTPKNIAAVALAPMTGGASLALLEDGNGDNILKSGIDELTGAKSAREQNEKNIEYQKEANAQNIAMQHETNAMTIDLANTAHQREVADLQKAGLNPVLSAGGTGAITPALGTASVTAPQVQNELPGGYLAQAMQAAQIANLASSAKQANAQAKATPMIAESEINKNNAETALALTNAANAGTKTTAMINDENLANSWWGRNISPVLRDIFGSGAAQTVANTATSARNANTMANAIKKTPHTHVHYH